jgi:hypothetical protein
LVGIITHVMFQLMRAPCQASPDKPGGTIRWAAHAECAELVLDTDLPFESFTMTAPVGQRSEDLPGGYGSITR